MWKLVRIWILFSWSFLTIGILLGSWWAYHELGWGGWWFWDPVENASLMPWLLATACIHSITKPKLNYWTLICTQGTFILSILGTFFVRSGLLSSVHSFATDSTRGLYLLLFLLSITAISVFNWISLCFNISLYERLSNFQTIFRTLLASKNVVGSWEGLGSFFRRRRPRKESAKHVDYLTTEEGFADLQHLKSRRSTLLPEVHLSGEGREGGLIKQSPEPLGVKQSDKRIRPKGGSSASEIKRSLEQILFLQNFYLSVICIVVFCGTSAPLLFQWLWERDVGTGAPFYNAICIPLFTSVFFVLVYVHYIQFNISNKFTGESPDFIAWVVERLTTPISANFCRPSPANLPIKGCLGSHVDTLLFLYCIFFFFLHVFIGVQLIGLNFLDSIYAAICFLLISSIILSSLLRAPNSRVSDTFMTSLSSLPSRHLVLTPKDSFGHQPYNEGSRLFQFERAANNSSALTLGLPEIRKECATEGFTTPKVGANLLLSRDPQDPLGYLGSKRVTKVPLGKLAPFYGIPQIPSAPAAEVNYLAQNNNSRNVKELYAGVAPRLTANNGAFFVFAGNAVIDPILRALAFRRTKEDCLIPSNSESPATTLPSPEPNRVGLRQRGEPEVHLISQRAEGVPGGGVHPAQTSRPLAFGEVLRQDLRKNHERGLLLAPMIEGRDARQLKRYFSSRIKVLPSAPLTAGGPPYKGSPSLQMNVAHTGIVLFIIGILLSNTFKFEFTEQLHSGPSGIRLGSQICCLRSIDHSFAPTYHSICANLLVHQQVHIDGSWLLRGPSPFAHNLKQVLGLVRPDQRRGVEASAYAVCMFPEKRFYYSNQAPQGGPNAGGSFTTTKVAIHSNLFTDFYSLIGTGSFETGWFTTIMKLPFIFCIWLGFIFGVIGGFFSLKKQLQKSKLYWL